MPIKDSGDPKALSDDSQPNQNLSRVSHLNVTPSIKAKAPASPDRVHLHALQAQIGQSARSHRTRAELSTELSQDTVHLHALQAQIEQSARSHRTRERMSTELSQDTVHLHASTEECCLFRKRNTALLCTFCVRFYWFSVLVITIWCGKN